ncbi:hypothetical protein BDV12DRAFT_165668 [Aspergillus spectabilis]
MTTNTHLSVLKAFLKDHPSIKHTLPTSPKFPSAKRVWNNSRHAEHTPLAVVQPQTPTDVAALIKLAKLNSVPFTIRAGGHNLEGRALVDKALLIDLRAFTSVSVSPDRKSATVGGGILQQELGNELWKEGLATPTGLVPAVGYVGWAIYGGYGPFSAHWGLGVDQIIGATVVNAEGELVTADDDLLHGIRGAGGAFGVIVDLTIKVYPLTSLLAGAIIFDSTDITKSFTTFNAAYANLLATESLPPQLSIQQSFLNTPHGRLFAAIFVWSGAPSSTEEGLAWSAKIASLGPLLLNTVAPTTIPQLFDKNKDLVPENVFGSSCTFNIAPPVSSALAETIAKHLARLPSDPVTMFSVHELRGSSPSIGPQSHKSVFNGTAREPHSMLEILGFATTDDARVESENWAAQMAADIEAVDGGIVLPSVYISLFNSTRAKSAEELLDKVYGEQKEIVRGLKRRFDPAGLFRLAVPDI